MKLLVAVDGLERSRPALEEAARLAASGEGSVTLLLVVPPQTHPASLELQTGWSGPSLGGPGTSEAIGPEDALARAQATLRQSGVEAETRLRHGDPASEILAELAEGSYDLLVIGSRGRSPVGRLLLGTTGSCLAEQAPCPVLVASPAYRVRVERRA